jgi:hypothetical protein
MNDEKLTIEIISEFMSPFEDHLTVLTLGDHIDGVTRNRIIHSFNNMRRSFTFLPGVNTVLEPITYISLTTSELFKGVAADVIRNEPCILFIDRELTKNIINILTDNNDDVDELDRMLIDRYLLSVGQEKFVLDTRDCDNDRVNQILNRMDERVGEFNYIILGDILALWIYDMDIINF